MCHKTFHLRKQAGEAANSVCVSLLSAPVEENGDNREKPAHPSTLPALPISPTLLSASCCAGSLARSAPPTTGCRVNIAWDREIVTEEWLSVG